MNVVRKVIVVGGMSLAMVGVGAGAAWAGAAWAGTPTPAPPRQASARPVQGAVPAARQVPAVLVGRVVRCDARSVTVRGNDGRTQVYDLPPRFVITKNGRAVAPTLLAPGDLVTVTGTPNGRSLVASRIVATRR